MFIIPKIRPEAEHQEHREADLPEHLILRFHKSKHRRKHSSGPDNEGTYDN